MVASNKFQAEFWAYVIDSKRSALVPLKALTSPYLIDSKQVISLRALNTSKHGTYVGAPLFSPIGRPQI